MLGNIFSNGSQIDAILIKKDSISIIDFKNYGGEIKFSENNSWKANDFEIKMDGKKPNPYRQISDAKFEIMNKINKNPFFKKGNELNLGHISGIVLFHQPIVFDRYSLPPKIASWVHVTDIMNSVKLIYGITSSQINLSDSEILNFPNLFDLKEYEFSRPRIAINEEKFINRDLLISELFKLEDIFKSIEVARKEGAKFVKTHGDFLKYFQNAYLSEKCIFYHISHFQKNYENKTEEFIRNQEIALSQQIDSIYNLNTINGYVLDEFTNGKTLKEFLLNITITRKLIDNLVRKYNHTISSKNLSIQAYKAYFNFFYERGIFDRQPLFFIRNELGRKEKLINYFHGLYVILKTWFGSDVILQHNINSKITEYESKEYLNIKTGYYLYNKDPNNYPSEEIEIKTILDTKEEDISIHEYEYARGISGRWYSKMMKQFNEEEGLEFYESISYTTLINGESEEKRLISKVKLPQQLISIFNELYIDISNIIPKEELDELLDLMNLNWIVKDWIDIREIHIMDLKTHFIYSNSNNIDYLINNNIYQYSGCFEPFYLTCLEQIGDWGFQDYKKSEGYSKTYLIFKKYETLIDNLPSYPAMLPPNRIKRNNIYEYPYKSIKHLEHVSEECKVSVDELFAFLLEIDSSFSEKYIPNGINKLNVRKEYKILLKKFKILPSDTITAKDPVKTTTHNEVSLIGYHDIKLFIEDSLEPYKNPDLAKKYGLTNETSMILYGPPGCGKTAWADQIARLLDLKLEKIPRSEFGSTYVDGAMLALTKRLDEIEKKAPIAVFFDEFDSVAPKREAQRESNDEGKKVVNTLLQRIQDLLGRGVVVLAATNFIGDLDSAVIRPGRFNLHIPIFPPLPRERIEIILHYLSGDNAEAIIRVLSNSYADTNDFWIEYVESMNLFSNSHVINFCDKLKNHVFKQSKENSIDEICFTDEVIIKALNLVKSQIRKADIEIYKKFYSDSENLNELFKERMERLKYEIDKMDNNPEKGRRRVGF